MNSTIIDNTPVDALPTVYKSYGTVDFLIGLAICQGASVANAAGINLTKLDHVRNERVPKDQRRRDWLRPLWLAGLALYIASQLVGSTLALEYLRAEYVAPLGSTSLIFNFIFAKLLVGTSITRMDIAGTAVIILGVCGVVGFGNLRVSTAQDIENNLNLETLKHLWSRGGWIGYFVCLELVSGLVFYVASIIDRVWVERQELETAVDPEERIASARAPRDETFMQTVNRRRLVVRFAIKKAVENWTVSKPDVVIRKLSGLTWAVAGGLLAGQTLVFAKSAVKLVSSGADQLASPLSIFILVLLAFAAVVQIYCLNKGLKVYDSTLVVPLFFATYTASGFLNSLTYLDQYNNFKDWVFAMIWLSILVLILGVAVLSSKKPETPAQTKTLDEEADEGGPMKDVEIFHLPTLDRTSRKTKDGSVLLSKGRDGPSDPDWDDATKSSMETDSSSRPSFSKHRGEEFGSFVESRSPK